MRCALKPNDDGDVDVYVDVDVDADVDVDVDVDVNVDGVILRLMFNISSRVTLARSWKRS